MKVHIHDLMNNIEDSSVDIEEQNVVSSERIKELTKMKIQNAGYTKKRSKKGLVTIGIAVAVVAALGTTAFAVFNGGLGGLSFGKRSLAEEIEADTGVSIPEEVLATMPEQEFISLQGYPDSPEYQATAEWLAFESGYDCDRKIMDEHDAEMRRTGVDPFEEYNCYLVWSQEMVDKINEITAKYDLKLHTNITDCDEKDVNEMCGEVFSDGFTGAGYMYEDGTFNLDSEFNGIYFQIGRCMRGYFDTTYLNVGNAGDYEEYEYTTKSGITVTISHGKGGMGMDKWIVTANLKDSFVSLNTIPFDYDGNLKEYTKADIEALVDSIDFTKL